MINTLKGKISIVYLSLVLMIAIVGIASVTNLFYLSKAIDRLMISNYKSINAANNMIEALEQQDNAVLTYISVDRQKGIELFSESGDVFSEWNNVVYNNITEEGESQFIERINAYHNEYNKLFYKLQEIKNGNDAEGATEFYNSSILPVYNNVKDMLKRLTLLNEKAMLYKKIKATNNAQSSMYIIIVLSTIAVVGGFLASRFFVNKFLSPINRLTKSIRLVKEGDLNQQILVLSNDEVGELAQEFNNMTRRLQDYEHSVLGQVIEEKNKTLALVKSISDPLIVLDTNFKIMLLNNECEKFFNIKEAEVNNKHFLEAIKNGEIFDHVASILKTKKEYIEKIIHIESDEDYFFNVVVSISRDSEANIKGIIVAFQDVTQLKKLERLKTDFVATVSHEFKTPLTSIAMGTSLLLEEGMGTLNKDQIDILGTIKEDGIKLNNLVTDLLALTKIESDRSIFKMDVCSIGSIIEASYKQFHDSLQQKNIYFVYELEDDLPSIHVDKDKIAWVINNLISNAIKFTNAENEICVSAFEKEGFINVSVKDTGVGIAPEYHEMIFNKFFQIKNHNYGVQGTGLGLSIVKEIIEAHGGRIWCDSKPGAGSNFTFTLPIISSMRLTADI